MICTMFTKHSTHLVIVSLINEPDQIFNAKDDQHLAEIKARCEKNPRFKCISVFTKQTKH